MDAGLCGECRHCQLVDAPRSRYYLCRRSFEDERFRKYPVLPVRACIGYEPGTPQVSPARPERAR